MNYTSIEQSKKLLELGLKAETADACYDVGYGQTKAHIECENFISYFTNDEFPELKDRYIPCWSLGALMDLLPPSIQTGEGMQNQYEINIRKYWGEEENLYQIAYGNDRGLSEEWHDMINTGEKESLCDAVFEMVCWLLKNGYIKKGE